MEVLDQIGYDIVLGLFVPIHLKVESYLGRRDLRLALQTRPHVRVYLNLEQIIDHLHQINSPLDSLLLQVQVASSCEDNRGLVGQVAVIWGCEALNQLFRWWHSEKTPPSVEGFLDDLLVLGDAVIL